MVKMQAIDIVLVTSDEGVEKRFPQVGGVGGRVDLGEVTAKMEQRKGDRD